MQFITRGNRVQVKKYVGRTENGAPIIKMIGALDAKTFAPVGAWLDDADGETQAEVDDWVERQRVKIEKLQMIDAYVRYCEAADLLEQAVDASAITLTDDMLDDMRARVRDIAKIAMKMQKSGEKAQKREKQEKIDL